VLHFIHFTFGSHSSVIFNAKKSICIAVDMRCVSSIKLNN